MARTRTSQLVVELLDRVTGPARAVGRAMQGMGRRIGDATGALPPLTQRVDAALARNRAALDGARTGVLDAAAAFYGLRAALGAPLAAAANFETMLEDIGQKAGVPVAQLSALGDRIRQVARETNQANSDIASAVDALAGRGASLDVALTAAAPIGKAATAYRAATDDLAAASWAAVDNLKVPADQIGKSLDIMSSAGKAGAFELRDMAQYFPQLGAAYQGLGQEGTGAVADLSAALQVVRKGTGDSSTAATNLANVLQKVYAPSTVKAFGRQGVDVFAEMEAAAARGLTPIEAIAELTDKTLKGDLSKMGNLFEDAQVQAGMRSLIQNKDEYRRIRAEALAADGVVDEDFERRIRTAAGVTKRWRAMMDNLTETIGAALVPVLVDLADVLGPIITKVTDWIAANPRLASSLMLVTGGLIAFRGALAALRFVGLLGQGGALSLLSFGLNNVAGSAARLYGAARASMALNAALAGMAGVQAGRLSQMGAALRGIAGVTGLRVVASAISAVVGAVGSISAPVWAAVAVAVAAVGTAWRYWDRISAIIEGVADAIWTKIGPAMKRLRENLAPIEPVIRAFGAAWDFVAGKVRAVVDAVRNIGRGAFTREILTDAERTELRNRAAQVTTDIVNAISELPGQLLDIGRSAIDHLWSGMKERLGDLLSWAQSIGPSIRSAIGDLGMSIVTGGRSDAANFDASSTSALQAQGGDTGGLSAPRAKGGPVSAGSTRLVGEHGPELFTAGRSGYVHPNGAAPSGAAPVVHLNPVIHVNGAGDPEGVARRVLSRLSEEASAAMRSAMADMELG